MASILTEQTKQKLNSLLARNDKQRFNSVRSQLPATGLGFSGQVTTPYGGSTRYEAKHPGVDIANQIGTPIKSTRRYKVVEVVAGRRQGDPGFGNLVKVVDDRGNHVQWSHLETPLVKPGQYLMPGQLIGLVGNSGQTYSLHGGTGAHADIRVTDVYKKYINPLSYFNS